MSANEFEGHTPGDWRPGQHFGCVVADHLVPGIGGSDDVEYYGGHLIAESAAPQNISLIAAAPRLLRERDELLETVRVILSNPHVNLGDLVYKVRDEEGLGWEGPSVIEWSRAVAKLEELAKGGDV